MALITSGCPQLLIPKLLLQNIWIKRSVVFATLLNRIGFRFPSISLKNRSNFLKSPSSGKSFFALSRSHKNLEKMDGRFYLVVKEQP